MGSPLAASLVDFVNARFRAAADPQRAVEMAAYMKTDMPFHGVPKPLRAPVYKEVKRRFKPGNAKEYREAILALWAQPHREEKYAAIEYAMMHRPFITSTAMPTYRRLIVEGAWWDLVDHVACHLVGGVWLRERDTITPTMDQWIDHKDIWLRRTAIIGQTRHKAETDEARLFDYCLRRAHEKEFFIRKAIGWALRQYSYTQPQGIKSFLLKHRDTLSPLSYREGAKVLVREGKMRFDD